MFQKLFLKRRTQSLQDSLAEWLRRQTRIIFVVSVGFARTGSNPVAVGFLLRVMSTSLITKLCGSGMPRGGVEILVGFGVGDRT